MLGDNKKPSVPRGVYATVYVKTEIPGSSSLMKPKVRRPNEYCVRICGPWCGLSGVKISQYMHSQPLTEMPLNLRFKMDFL